MRIGNTLSRMWRTLLLMAFVLQCVVVQAHVHAATFAGRPSASPADRHSVGHPTFASAFELCPLCWEAAVAGHYSLPGTPVVQSAPATAFWIVASVVGAFTLTQYPLGWLSRAPPQ